PAPRPTGRGAPRRTPGPPGRARTRREAAPRPLPASARHALATFPVRWFRGRRRRRPPHLPAGSPARQSRAPAPHEPRYGAPRRRPPIVGPTAEASENRSSPAAGPRLQDFRAIGSDAARRVAGDGATCRWRPPLVTFPPIPAVGKVIGRFP